MLVAVVVQLMQTVVEVTVLEVQAEVVPVADLE